MKYIFLFLLILVSCALIIRNIAIENNIKKASSKKDFFRDNTSEALMIFMVGNISSNKTQDDSVPEVKILLSEDREFFSWDSQIRYSINVSDIEDGHSKYGEINGNEVLLEIEYLPMTNEEEIKEYIKISKKEPEHKGLALMKRSTCFGCHADKTRIAGPSFSEMAERYERTFSNIKSLASNISEGSSGIWGSSTMPAHPDFTIKETEQIADYILEQGGRKNKWILPDLEGTFQIIKKPENVSQGLYILTASYTSQSQVRGQHSIILTIK